jgi:polysaccharide export outer membrane protein
VSESQFPTDRRFVRLALVSLAAIALLGGCIDKRGGPIPYDVQNFGLPDAPKVVPLEENYRIAPLDVLNVRVFKMTDLTGDYEVDLTGKISMPLIGEISAIDLTTAELDQRLTTRLGEKYLENPDVSVGIKSSTRRSVTVDGSVGKSGTFPINGPTSLIQAIAAAGGVSENGNPRRVAIFRQIGGQRQAAAFDLTSIRRGEAADPPIYAGDIIVVDGSATKAAQRQILNSLPILSIFRPF